MRAALALILAVLTTACAQFPELEGTVAPAALRAPYPDLVPLGDLLPRVDAEGADPEVVEREMAARIAALNARARILRTAPIDGPDLRPSGGPSE